MDDSPTTRLSLLARVGNLRDERAWLEFTEIYTPLVLRLARQRGMQDADAADLAQEVFQTVALALERQAYDPERGSFRGWLFTIGATWPLTSWFAAPANLALTAPARLATCLTPLKLRRRRIRRYSTLSISASFFFGRETRCAGSFLNWRGRLSGVLACKGRRPARWHWPSAPRWAPFITTKAA